MREGAAGNMKSLLSLLSSTRNECASVSAFEFSKYSYQPQTVSDRRHIVRILANELSTQYEAATATLGPTEELALHSRVYSAHALDLTLHIPMVDLLASGHVDQVEGLCELFGEFGCHEVALVDSGRSFHVYGLSLLPPDAWVKFMARLLLLNPPSGRPYVDTRWVGHRLLAGYGALRLSCNSSMYVAVPSVVDVFEVSNSLDCASAMLRASTRVENARRSVAM